MSFRIGATDCIAGSEPEPACGRGLAMVQFLAQQMSQKAD
jgi:hypothetical protein